MNALMSFFKGYEVTRRQPYMLPEQYAIPRSASRTVPTYEGFPRIQGAEQSLRSGEVNGVGGRLRNGSGAAQQQPLDKERDLSEVWSPDKVELDEYAIANNYPLPPNVAAAAANSSARGTSNMAVSENGSGWTGMHAPVNRQTTLAMVTSDGEVSQQQRDDSRGNPSIASPLATVGRTQETMPPPPLPHASPLAVPLPVREGVDASGAEGSQSWAAKTRSFNGRELVDAPPHVVEYQPFQMEDAEEGVTVGNNSSLAPSRSRARPPGSASQRSTSSRTGLPAPLVSHNLQSAAAAAANHQGAFLQEAEQPNGTDGVSPMGASGNALPQHVPSPAKGTANSPARRHDPYGYFMYHKEAGAASGGTDGASAEKDPGLLSPEKDDGGSGGKEKHTHHHGTHKDKDAVKHHRVSPRPSGNHNHHQSSHSNHSNHHHHHGGGKHRSPTKTSPHNNSSSLQNLHGTHPSGGDAAWQRNHTEGEWMYQLDQLAERYGKV